MRNGIRLFVYLLKSIIPEPPRVGLIRIENGSVDFECIIQDWKRRPCGWIGQREWVGVEEINLRSQQKKEMTCGVICVSRTASRWRFVAPFSARWQRAAIPWSVTGADDTSKWRNCRQHKPIWLNTLSRLADPDWHGPHPAEKHPRIPSDFHAHFHI